MKFLACSRCFSANPNNGAVQSPQEITNPLVVTKRPVAKVLHPSKSTAAPSTTRQKRFPAFFRALASWPKRRRQQPKPNYHSPAPKNIRKTVRVIEPPARRRHRPATRTQRLIRLYEARAASPEANRYQEFLIDPPASFSGDDSLESHQNFRNNLNTLDFKRMNTVALEEASPAKSAFYRKNSYNELDPNLMPIVKFARKTLLEDFLKERMKIEQTMIDLLNGRDPGSLALKKSRNDDKKMVRFDIAKNVELPSPDAKPATLTEEEGRVQRDTEIKLSVDPASKVEDFYVERKTTFLKDKTVEDKALVLKIGKRDELDVEETRGRELLFRNFGKMTL